MTLLRPLALVCALAVPLTAVHVTITSFTAEAAGKKQAKAKPTKKVKQDASKSCGAYKYLKDGKCLDARDKK
jgi:hypothetical protein